MFIGLRNLGVNSRGSGTGATAIPIELVATGSGTNSASLPAIQAGDLLIVCAMMIGGFPTTPVTMTNLRFGGGTVVGARAAGRVLDGSETDTGVFTNATDLVYGIYRNTGNGGSTLTGTGTTATIRKNQAAGCPADSVRSPVVPLFDTSGNSWVLNFTFAEVAAGSDFSIPPAGMTSRVSAANTYRLSMSDTNSGVTAWAQQDFVVGGTTNDWATITVEITQG